MARRGSWSMPSTYRADAESVGWQVRRLSGRRGMKSRTSITGATMAKPPHVGPSQALEEAEVSVPGIAAALMSRDMPVADAAMTAALLQRLEKRDREKAGATSAVLEIDPEDLPIPLSGLRKGQRFREIAELRRFTQEWALAEWNAGSQHPPWRRDGALAMVVHPGPAQPTFFGRAPSRRSLGPRRPNPQERLRGRVDSWSGRQLLGPDHRGEDCTLHWLSTQTEGLDAHNDRLAG